MNATILQTLNEMDQVRMDTWKYILLGCPTDTKKINKIDKVQKLTHPWTAKSINKR